MHLHVVVAILVLAFGLSVDKASGNDMARSRLLQASEFSGQRNEQGTTIPSIKFIPHIAQGGGWSTELHVFNTCSSPDKYVIGFYDSDGESQLFRVGEAGVNTAVIGGSANDIFRPIEAGRYHFWRLPNTGEATTQGYGVFLDGDEVSNSGCVAVDARYVQHLPNGKVLSSTIPYQTLSSAPALSGVTLPFVNTASCVTGVAVISNGETPVNLNAMSWNGEIFGQANLGNLRHTSFLTNDLFPVQGATGTIHVGTAPPGTVNAIGLEFCNGELRQFRLPSPRPTWFVVSFDEEFIGTVQRSGIPLERYSYHVTLRNTTWRDRTYYAALLLKGNYGEIVGRSPLCSETFVLDCSDLSLLSVPAGQERTVSGLQDLLLFNEFYDSGDVASVEIEIIRGDAASESTFRAATHQAAVESVTTREEHLKAIRSHSGSLWGLPEIPRDRSQ